jgi:hypothetical protein
MRRRQTSTPGGGHSHDVVHVERDADQRERDVVQSERDADQRKPHGHNENAVALKSRATPPKSKATPIPLTRHRRIKPASNQREHGDDRIVRGSDKSNVA